MKATSLFLPLLISFTILVNPAVGQAKKQPASCPMVNVTAPITAEAGTQTTLTVNVTGGDTKVTPTYNWVVSNGIISEGQGTSIIKIDLNGVAGNSTVTATVDVGGYNPACSTTNSSSFEVLPKAEARKVDEYGQIAPQDENKRLGNFVIEMMTDPTVQGYIIFYKGRTTQAAQARKATKRIKAEMMTTAKLPAERFVMLDGGYREELAVELWIVPSGATPPQPTPTLAKSEIQPSAAVKSTKRKSSAQRKR